ncbi:Galactosyl_T_2 [Nesidiocoris tenuis]|uniref:Beta-1,4-N-acetylgalactosaminyltransferase n=1 Tax=Nesidiocoris tenuis TaxID=355587 RepID=A0ABN7AQQ6_9HEMI|nr:Galactosyl_T_2 [Nesidiocoris tenuis]
MAWSLSGRRLFCFHGHLRLLVSLLPAAIVVNVLLYVLLFSKSRVVVLQPDDIAENLVADAESLRLLNATRNAKVCDVFAAAKMTAQADEALDSLAERYGVRPGGAWRPKDCVPLYRIAVIVSYRDRPDNLNDFLAYMHPFLSSQNLDYRIVIVEQVAGRPFNRAKLFNVGFQEIEKLKSSGQFAKPPSCYIFHDVDLIPQDGRNVYACTKLVRHMSANIDVFEYKVPYDSIIGGAVAVGRRRFLEANGFSNTFFGWGGEDDDFYNRITRDGGRVCRYSADVSRYVMLSHKKQKPSADRYYFLVTGKDRYATDGLNSLKYTVVKFELLPLYTRIVVDI